ncbi:Transposase, IS204/IS1001/IS1096/IS1165 [mine drainage metagenome]|uniref:Transposase, IS204/IS1001/IS1096/IS1165 n=1 Tax=mine drainage metagenome TaxID=410659 RepID=T1AKM8_9ZZZZ
MDMWDPYIASTRKHVDSADSKMVFDRFHIMKHMNMAVDDVRRQESALPKTREMLKKTRYIWLYSHENLPEKYGKGTRS